MYEFFRFFKKNKTPTTKKDEKFNLSSKDSFFIAKIACSKIIHDLAGSVGSASNSFEMLKDSSDESEKQELIYLIENSLLSLSSRIKIFRLAFDLSYGEKKFEEIKALMHEYSSSLSNIINLEIVSAEQKIKKNIYCIASCLFFYIAESCKTVENLKLELGNTIIATIEGSFQKEKIMEIKNIKQLVAKSDKETFVFYFAKKIEELSGDIKIQSNKSSKLIFKICLPN